VSGRSTLSSATDGGRWNNRTGRHTLPATGCGHVGGKVKRTVATTRTRPHSGVGKRGRRLHIAHDPVPRGQQDRGAATPNTTQCTTGPGPRGAKTPCSPDRRAAGPQPPRGHGPWPTPEPAHAVTAKTGPNGREQRRTNFKATQKLSNIAIKVQPKTLA
jgi:hypothetical protein